MRVLAFDPFVSAERYRELGVEKSADSDEIYAQADFITVHLPKTPETEGWLNADAFAKMRDGVRILNVARGGLVDDAALKDALDSGKVGGAALDVSPSEPITDYPLFHGYPHVVVTPHLGASTAEATDRAGYQSAEQVVAALTGGVVRPPSTSLRSAPRTCRCSARSCRWRANSGAWRWRSPRAAPSSGSRLPSSGGSPTSTRAC